MASAEQPVKVSTEGAVTTITLDRPGRRNALDLPMCLDLESSLRAIAESPARVVILRGEGEDFCVGADLTPEAWEAPLPELWRLERIFDAATLLHAMPQVTIAAIDGGCAGAAMGWAMACDFRFATPEARFNTAFLNVGLAGEMGLGWTLTRLVGPARARELLMFPGKMTADEALALGMVTRIHPRAELHAQTLAAAAELCARPADTLRMMKANLVAAEADDLARYVAVETGRQMFLVHRPDMAQRFAQAKPRG